MLVLKRHNAHLFDKSLTFDTQLPLFDSFLITKLNSIKIEALNIFIMNCMFGSSLYLGVERRKWLKYLRYSIVF